LHPPAVGELGDQQRRDHPVQYDGGRRVAQPSRQRQRRTSTLAPTNQLRPGAGSKYRPLVSPTITEPEYLRSKMLFTRTNCRHVAAPRTWAKPRRALTTVHAGAA